MPEQLVYLRGDFSYGEHRDFAGPEFAEGARAFLGLAPAAVRSLEVALRTHPGFLDRKGMTELVRGHVADPGQADSIVSVIVTVERVLRQTGLSVEEFTKRLPDLVRKRVAREESAPPPEPSFSPLSQEEVEELARRISLLLGAGTALARQRKAERLLKTTGHALEELQLICDLRPVFDDERANVDGMVPITTLRVVATSDSGMPMALEARMSSQQLKDLEKKVGLALIKLRTLEELLTQKGIALPALEGGPSGE
ncbi:MAG TPA: hypothetical protein VKA46_22580 [Gemmataceae bacterium]|nr:hypothetical protein [Gemmataceae bacterium]